MTILEVKDLQVTFQTQTDSVPAVRGVSYSLKAGKTLGCVGESGSGKSVTAQTILGLNTGAKTQISGKVFFDGVEVDFTNKEAIQKLRGNDVAMIFQDPLSSLHPFYTVGNQIAEAYLVHHPKATKAEARVRTLEVMNQVGIPVSETRIDDYPHQFSGGMRQRIMIAMALVNNPKVLIADEPTTALDVTVQAQILDLLKKLQKETGMSILLITHDFGVVKEMCDEVVVMYAGKVVETGPVAEIFKDPQHPYTRGLLDSLVANEDSDKPLIPIPGTPPTPAEFNLGCSFAPRCRWAGKDGIDCNNQIPELVGTAKHQSACLLPTTNRSKLFASRTK
ncbi:MAG: ABC transporter ATP-binding protein [Actinomycetota bacterium]